MCCLYTTQKVWIKECWFNFKRTFSILSARLMYPYQKWCNSFRNPRKISWERTEYKRSIQLNRSKWSPSPLVSSIYKRIRKLLSSLRNRGTSIQRPPWVSPISRTKFAGIRRLWGYRSNPSISYCIWCPRNIRLSCIRESRRCEIGCRWHGWWIFADENPTSWRPRSAGYHRRGERNYLKNI